MAKTTLSQRALTLRNKKTIHLRQHFFDTPVPQPNLGRVLNKPHTPGRRHADLSGMKVWPCSLRFLDLLVHAELPQTRQQYVKKNEKETPLLNLLELGAGAGLLGIGLAASCDNIRVVTTDPGLIVSVEDGNTDTLTWLRLNVEANRHLFENRLVTAEQLLWGEEEHICKLMQSHPTFDIILGCELLYDPDQYGALITTLDAFLLRGNFALLAYSKRHDGEHRFLQMASDQFAVVDTREFAANPEAGTPAWAITRIGKDSLLGSSSEM